MTQRIAIMGGMDWVDASVDFVNLPDEVDADKLYEEYKNYRTEMQSAGKAWYERNPDWPHKKPENDPYPSFLNFRDWLLEKSVGTKSDVIEWWEGYL